MQGTVKQVMSDKGFGFITGADGKSYFFHRSALKNMRIEELKKDQTVTFEESEGSKGPRAEDVFVD